MDPDSDVGMRRQALIFGVKRLSTFSGRVEPAMEPCREGETSRPRGQTLDVRPLTQTDIGLSTIIVTYNSGSVLPGLLDSLSAGLQGIKQLETIVVDNDSADNSVDIALSHVSRPRVIRMGRNAGYAAAINAAAATVQPHANLLILNPDIRLLPGAARILIDRLTDSSVGVAAPRILAENGTTQLSLRREPSLMTAWTDAILGGSLATRIGIGEVIGNRLIYDRGGSIDWATGAILAVAMRARSVVGDWDESFFLYSEEVDYQRRVRENGLFVAYVPQAQAIHIGREYLQNPRLSALMTANRIRYYRRHHGPISTALFRLSIILGEVIRGFLGPGHRAALRAALTPWKPPPESQPHPSLRLDNPHDLQTSAKSVPSISANEVEQP
jgi:N-acetylglucosaminyl-diphospho-decaprenol L-rhamnosyltransferase